MSVDDGRFMRNVRNARENGFDLVCADCGEGFQDDTDSHEMFCPRNPELEENQELARRWAQQQRIGGS